MVGTGKRREKDGHVQKKRGGSVVEEGSRMKNVNKGKKALLPNARFFKRKKKYR